MDPELVKTRRFIQDKILEFLTQKQAQPHGISQRRIIDLTKRLEEGLFRTATSQEEYLNLDTLESRLHLFIKRPQPSSNSPQHLQLTSAPLGNMIPTPGMPQDGNTNSVFSSEDESAALSSVDSSSTHMLPTENGDLQPENNSTKVMKVIEEMIAEGLMVEGSPLWCFTISALTSEQQSSMFLALPRNTGRLAWMKWEFKKYDGGD